MDKLERDNIGSIKRGILKLGGVQSILNALSAAPAFTKNNIAFSIAQADGYIPYSANMRIWCGYYGIEFSMSSLKMYARKFYISYQDEVQVDNWKEIPWSSITT